MNDQTYDCVGVFNNKLQFFLNFHKSCVDDADLTNRSAWPSWL